MLRVTTLNDHFFFINDELFFGEFEYYDEDVVQVKEGEFRVNGTLYLKKSPCGKRISIKQATLYIYAEDLDDDWFDAKIFY